MQEPTVNYTSMSSEQLQELNEKQGCSWDCLNMSDGSENKSDAEEPNELDITPKLIHTVAIISSITTVLVVGSNNNWKPNEIIAILLACVLTIDWTEWMYYFCYTKRLHQLRVATKYIDEADQSNFGKISIPYKLVYGNKLAITTVSGLSALRGSNQNRIILQMSDISMYGIIFALAIYGDMKEVHAILAYISGLGMFFIGFWEFNRSSSIHMSLHMLGTTLAAGMPLAFGIQQSWSIFAILLIVVSALALGLLCTMWMYDFGGRIPMESDDPEKIHRTSKICIITEFVALIAAAISGCAYIYFL